MFFTRNISTSTLNVHKVSITCNMINNNMEKIPQRMLLHYFEFFLKNNLLLLKVYKYVCVLKKRKKK